MAIGYLGGVPRRNEVGAQDATERAAKRNRLVYFSSASKPNFEDKG